MVNTTPTGRYRVKPGAVAFICTGEEQTPEGIWTANETFLTEGDELDITGTAWDDDIKAYYYEVSYNGYEYYMEAEELQHLEEE